MPMELYRIQVSDLQQRLARKATAHPAHRFTHLYDLLTWAPLMNWAFDTLMSNTGSRTAGVDGITRRAATTQRDRILTNLINAFDRKVLDFRPSVITWNGMPEETNSSMKSNI